MTIKKEAQKLIEDFGPKALLVAKRIRGISIDQATYRREQKIRPLYEGLERKTFTYWQKVVDAIEQLKSDD